MSACARVCLSCVRGVGDRALLGVGGAEVPAVLSRRAVHLSSPPSLPNQHQCPLVPNWKRMKVAVGMAEGGDNLTSHLADVFV